MLAVVASEEAGKSADPVGGSLLDEIVRDGARRMLAAALQAEVAAYIGGHADQVDELGHRLVVRNGLAVAREVVSGAGSFTVGAPRVNDKRVDPATAVRRGSPPRSCRRGRGSRRRSPRCCCCCTCMGCPVWISDRRWSSFWDQEPACRQARSLA